MPVVMSDDEFDGLVSDALDQVPAEAEKIVAGQVRGRIVVRIG